MTALTSAKLSVDKLEDRSVPATLPTGFGETVIATGLSNATAMEVAPNGDLWVLQQGGAVKRFRAGSSVADDVANIGSLGIRSEGERGLLGIAFDPNYAANKHLFLYYTKDNPAGAEFNRISRFTVNDSNPADYSFDPLAETVILNLDPLSSATNHNGGAIHFGPDGKLYAAVGDNALGSNAQNPNNRHGKVLRLNPDGSIPADNPATIAGLGATSGANRAIWAAGLRNPYTFTFQPGTGTMYVNDVGQNTWEEINEGGAGRNFGWPGTEGDFNQASFPNFTRPVYAYSHGGGTFQGFAITGGAFYNPTTNQFPSEYTGDYFFADFVNDWVNVRDAATGTVTRFATGADSVVDLKVTDAGELLYLARGTGQVFKVAYTAGTAPTISQQPQDVTVSTGGTATFSVTANGSAPLAYQWQKFNGSTWGNLSNGTGVSGATTATLTLTNATAATAGQYRVVVSNPAGSVTSTSATLTVTANQPPTGRVNVTGGLTSGKFIAGQAITFGGTGTDPEDGTLGPAAFTWKVEYITSIASGNPVVRPFVPEFGNATGGTFTPATTGPYTLTDVAYRITLVVRDSAGLTNTQVFDVLPNTAAITITSNLSGATLTLDGQPYPAPTTVQSVVGFQRPIGAAATQVWNGFTYRFRNWSDGGAATHTITTPLSGGTYTATYAFDVKIDYTKSGSSVPSGYLGDVGSVYANRNNGYTYGWNANNSSTARDRNSSRSPDQRYDTLQHMQKPENRNAVWELAVPNGTYRVRIVAGDPSHIDSVYRINAEGVLAVSGTPTSSQRFFDNTVTVTVTDGKLTVSNAAGARNNKIAFIEVEQVLGGGGSGGLSVPEGGGNGTEGDRWAHLRDLMKDFRERFANIDWRSLREVAKSDKFERC